jgi:hypothetical protein
MEDQEAIQRQPQVATSDVVCDIMKEGTIRQAGDEYCDGTWRPIPEDRYGLPLFPESFPHRRPRSHTVKTVATCATGDTNEAKDA